MYDPPKFETPQERDQAEHEWLADARRQADEGFAALDRGEGVRCAIDDLMARIDVAVLKRARERTSG